MKIKIKSPCLSSPGFPPVPSLASLLRPLPCICLHPDTRPNLSRMYGHDHCRKAFTVLVLWESFSSTGRKAAYSRRHKKAIGKLLPIASILII